MMAGDQAFQTEILVPVYHEVQRRVAEHPEVWLFVKDIAELYRETYNRAVLKRCEQAMLAPLGLTAEALFAKDSDVRTEVVNRLVSDMRFFEPPRIETMVTGYDADGAHIYTIRDGDVTMNDMAGFAAIGSGAWHAESQLMRANINLTTSLPSAIWHTYTAKKRSEVAQGVGSATDMVVVGAAFGHSHIVKPEEIAVLDEVYAKIVDDEKKADGVAIERVAEHVKEVNETSQAQTASQEPPRSRATEEDQA
jgi:hypothetical protein